MMPNDSSLLELLSGCWCQKLKPKMAEKAKICRYMGEGWGEMGQERKRNDVLNFEIELHMLCPGNI